MPFIATGDGIYRISAEQRAALEADRGYFHAGAEDASAALWPGYPSAPVSSDPVVPAWHPWPPDPVVNDE